MAKGLSVGWPVISNKLAHKRMPPTGCNVRGLDDERRACRVCAYARGGGAEAVVGTHAVTVTTVPHPPQQLERAGKECQATTLA